MTSEATENPGAVGSPVECAVGRLVPERTNCDAPICPWCDQQGWDTCQQYDDTRECMRAWRLQ